MQALIRYGFFIPLGADLTLNNFLFILLMTATVCIAAAGNIINNIPCSSNTNGCCHQQYK